MNTSREPPFPQGMSVELDPELRISEAGVLYGGSPPRLVKLSPAGRNVLADLRRHGVSSPASTVLARRLTDAGMAHPRPLLGSSPPDMTVVIPVRDRVAELNRVFDALGARSPVVVVDDGSMDADAIAGLSEGRGARLGRHTASRGPAAARNTGWRAVGTGLVAFVDSDAIPDPGSLEALAAHFADPLVGALAPRIEPTVPAPSVGRAIGRYAASHSPLDLGPLPAVVRPGSRVSFVPTVTLVVRRTALEEVGGFDEALRYGEDVDLVWRLADAGWRVRYDPSVVVTHEEPGGFGSLLARRFHYGTSAARLARRHPGHLYSIVIIPWAGLVVGGALTARPLVVLAGLVAGAAMLGRSRRSMRMPAPWALGGQAVIDTFVSSSRAVAQFAWPAAVLGLAWPGGESARGSLRRRVAIGALVAGAPAVEWLRRRPGLDPARWSALYLIDEASYGAGVVWGCLREHCWAPLRPRTVVKVLGG